MNEPFYFFYCRPVSAFGGAVNVRSEHFQKVNGFSNVYWGWGCEDDDLYIRFGIES